MINVELSTLWERAYPSIPEKRNLRTKYSGGLFHPAIPLRTMRLAILPLVTLDDPQLVSGDYDVLSYPTIVGRRLVLLRKSPHGLE